MRQTTVVAIALMLAAPISSQEYRPVMSNCKDGIVTLNFPEPVHWVKIDYAKIMARCTRPA
jgi:hypothetical protein